MALAGQFDVMQHYQDLIDGTKQLKTTFPEDIKDTNLSIEDIAHCPDNYTSMSSTIHSQKCCTFHNKLDQYATCLPSLVVMGAQKAGTTALHSYLLLHPNLRPTRKKEMHLFDFPKNYKILPQKMATLLIPQDVNSDSFNQQLFFESTPSYIADYKACGRIAYLLSKETKFIVLLRNPVDRLWSDLSMKSRRIQLQEDFLHRVLPAHQSQFYACWTKLCPSGPTNCALQVVRQCLPANLAQHGRTPTFLRWIQRVGKEDFVENCMKPPHRLIDCMQSSKYKGKILTETMPVLPDVLYDEMANVARIATACCTDDPSQHVDLFDTDTNTDTDADADTDHLCHGCGCRCFPRSPMISDVSRYFVWRSMYYMQLKHCFADLDPSRFLLVNNNRLATHPTETLNELFRFAGIPEMKALDLKQALTHEDLSKLFNKYYPDFEAVTGWSHDELKFQELTLSDTLRKQLDDFFRPYNRQLFEFLKIPPYDGWAV